MSHGLPGHSETTLTLPCLFIIFWPGITSAFEAQSLHLLYAENINDLIFKPLQAHRVMVGKAGQFYKHEIEFLRLGKQVCKG